MKIICDCIDKDIEVKYWYDKHTKSWIVQRKDKDGNQIGNADYVYTKKEATDLVQEYQKETRNCSHIKIKNKNVTKPDR